MSAGQVAALINRLDSCAEVINNIVQQALARQAALGTIHPGTASA